MLVKLGMQSWIELDTKPLFIHLKLGEWFEIEAALSLLYFHVGSHTGRRSVGLYLTPEPGSSAWNIGPWGGYFGWNSKEAYEAWAADTDHQARLAATIAAKGKLSPEVKATCGALVEMLRDKAVQKEWNRLMYQNLRVER